MYIDPEIDQLYLWTRHHSELDHLWSGRPKHNPIRSLKYLCNNSTIAIKQLVLNSDFAEFLISSEEGRQLLVDLPMLRKITALRPIYGGLEFFTIGTGGALAMTRLHSKNMFKHRRSIAVKMATLNLPVHVADSPWTVGCFRRSQKDWGAGVLLSKRVRQT